MSRPVLPETAFEIKCHKVIPDMGIPRSKLYLNVLLECLKKNNRKRITGKLNEVYSNGYYKEFEPIEFLGINN
jgi:hypothetical protein